MEEAQICTQIDLVIVVIINNESLPFMKILINITSFYQLYEAVALTSLSSANKSIHLGS